MEDESLRQTYNPDTFLGRTEDEPLLQHYQMLHDGLDVLIENERLSTYRGLSEDDYKWIVDMLLNALTIAATEDEA